MTAERFRLVLACIAGVAVALAACLFRYEFYVIPAGAGYLLDRWTSSLTLVRQDERTPVKFYSAPAP